MGRRHTPPQRRRTLPLRIETEETCGDLRGGAGVRDPRGARCLAPARPEGREGDGRCGTARACADPALAVPRQPHPCARVLARGRGEGRRPRRLARAHVTRAEEIGAAAARGGRLVQRWALTATSPPPPRSRRSLDGTFSPARLVDAAAASLSPRRPEEEEEGEEETPAGPPP